MLLTLCMHIYSVVPRYTGYARLLGEIISGKLKQLYGLFSISLTR